MRSECCEHRKRIAALVLGDATEEERRALEAHLATCSQCRSEREGYALTIQQMTSAGEESIPHHFLVYPEQRVSNPWQLFRRVQPGWQALAATAAVLFLFLGIAAVSHLQVRSGAGGWSVSFGGSDIDVAALKKEIIETAERKNQETRAAWMQEVRDEIERSHTTLTQQQKIQLTAALAGMESRIHRRISSSEARVTDTQRLAANVYRTMAQQRAQDLDAINLRFDSTEASNAVKTRQTNEILNTFLQIAELSLRR